MKAKSKEADQAQVRTPQEDLHGAWQPNLHNTSCAPLLLPHDSNHAALDSWKHLSMLIS